MIAQKLRHIGPPGPVPATPQCTAEIQYTDHSRKWRLEHGETEPFVCCRPSVVEIEGQHFCRLHGGHRALDLLLSGRLVEAPSEAE